VLAVYTGDAVDDLAEVDSKDDSNGYQSLVEFPITAGTDCRIAVSGYGLATGNIELNWSSVEGILVKLPISSVIASDYQDGHPPEDTIDADLNTRWSALGCGQWIEYDLESTTNVGLVKIAWLNGDRRMATFEIEVSSDGINWSQVYSGQSSGTTVNLESYDFNDLAARYVRIVGCGNTENDWNSITEVEIYGR
jgi:hypothetical protein